MFSINNRKVRIIIILVISVVLAYQTLKIVELSSSINEMELKIESSEEKYQNQIRSEVISYKERLIAAEELEPNTYLINNMGFQVKMILDQTLPDNIYVSVDPYTEKFGFYYMDVDSVFPLFTFRLTPHKPSTEEGDMSIYHEDNVYVEPTVLELGVSNVLSDDAQYKQMEELKSSVQDQTDP
jgi:hypothetical protein